MQVQGRLTLLGETAQSQHHGRPPHEHHPQQCAFPTPLLHSITGQGLSGALKSSSLVPVANLSDHMALAEHLWSLTRLLTPFQDASHCKIFCINASLGARLPVLCLYLSSHAQQPLGMAGISMQATAVLGRDESTLPDRLRLAWLLFAYSQLHSHMLLFRTAGSAS